MLLYSVLPLRVVVWGSGVRRSRGGKSKPQLLGRQCARLAQSEAHRAPHFAFASARHAAFISRVGFAAGGSRGRARGAAVGGRQPTAARSTRVPLWRMTQRGAAACESGAARGSRPLWMMRPALRRASAAASLSRRTASTSTRRPVNAARMRGGARGCEHRPANAALHAQWSAARVRMAGRGLWAAAARVRVRPEGKHPARARTRERLLPQQPLRLAAELP